MDLSGLIRIMVGRLVENKDRRARRGREERNDRMGKRKKKGRRSLLTSIIKFRLWHTNIPFDTPSLLQILQIHSK